MNNALVVMVHGSPRPESNQAMFHVVERVREVAAQTNEYSQVEVGFMECNEPTIPEAIETCVRAGATRIIAVPYFLHSGNHVADDLPTFLEEAQQRYPDVEFLMGDFLGHDPAVETVLLDRAREASP
jgi:sirohydrochlorin cobaltochelatase